LSSLKQKTVSGVVWTGFAKISMQLVLTLVMFILGNLLDKKDFGIIALAGIITVAIGMVNDKGLGTAVVQKKKLNIASLSSLFWAGILFGLFLYALTVAASFILPLFFTKFDAHLVQTVIAVIGLGFFIGAFGVVQKALLTRDMAFKKLGIIEIVAVFVSGAVAVILAFAGAGVWSLVVNVLLRDLITVISLWIICDWKPKFHFKLAEFIEYFRFSANVLANDVAIYLVTNTDITIIGKVLGDVLLGVYSWALYLVKLPVTRISGVVTKVVFPAFSMLQDDPKAFRKSFLKSTTFVAIITFPILAGIAIFCKELLLVFIPKYIDAHWPIVILTPMAMLKSIGTMKGSVLMAVGKPEIELRWNMVYILPLAGFVYWGTHYGLVGVSASFAIFYILTFPIIQQITNNQVGVRFFEYYRSLTVPFVATLSMAGIALLWQYLNFTFFNLNDWAVLLGGLLICMPFYVVALFVIQRSMLYEILFLFTKNKRFKPGIQTQKTVVV